MNFFQTLYFFSLFSQSETVLGPSQSEFRTKDLTKKMSQNIYLMLQQVQITAYSKNIIVCSKIKKDLVVVVQWDDLLVHDDGGVRLSHMCGLPGLPQKSKSVRRRREKAKTANFTRWHLIFSCDFNTV